MCLVWWSMMMMATLFIGFLLKMSPVDLLNDVAAPFVHWLRLWLLKHAETLPWSGAKMLIDTLSDLSVGLGQVPCPLGIQRLWCWTCGDHICNLCLQLGHPCCGLLWYFLLNGALNWGKHRHYPDHVGFQFILITSDYGTIFWGRRKNIYNCRTLKSIKMDCYLQKTSTTQGGDLS